MLARSGKYEVTSRVLDDDGNVYAGMFQACYDDDENSSEPALQSGSGISNWRKSGKHSSSHHIALSCAVTVQPIGYLCTIRVFVKPNVVVDLYQKFDNCM